MSINNVTLVGRLVKDPELKYSQSGIAMTRFTVAINRPFKNQNGETEADFISCQAFRKQAENLANYMRKGNQIGVIGRIQTGSYEKDGVRVYTTDVIAENIQFLEPRAQDGGNAPQSQQNNGGYQPQQNAPQQQYQQRQPQNGYPSQNQPPQYQQAPPQQQQTRLDQDPFANPQGQINVSEDDLPF